MLTLSDVSWSELPSPMPLWPTPLWRQLLGFPNWRFKRPHAGGFKWVYLTRGEYLGLFGGRNS